MLGGQCHCCSSNIFCYLIIFVTKSIFSRIYIPSQHQTTKWIHIHIFYSCRASEAYAQDHYKLISEMFTSRRTGPLDLNAHQAANLSLEDLYLRAKHHKNDMIFKWVWRLMGSAMPRRCSGLLISRGNDKLVYCVVALIIESNCVTYAWFLLKTYPILNLSIPNLSYAVGVGLL